AQHPPVEAQPGPEQPASQAHVRLVAGIEPEIPPPSRPRRGRAVSRSPLPAEYQSWKDVAPVEPAPPPDVPAPLADGRPPLVDEPVPVPDGDGPVADDAPPLSLPPVPIAAAMEDAVAGAAPHSPPMLHFDALADDSPAAAGRAPSSGRHSPPSRRPL